MSAAERRLRSGGRFLGGALAAIGFVAFTTEYYTWDQRPGSSSVAAFLGALALAMALWLVLRRRFPPPGRPVAREVAATSRTALLLAMPLLATCPLVSGFLNTRDRGYRQAMKSDLHSLHAIEAGFRTDSGRYIANVESFRTSAGVSRPAITLTADGWSATVEHSLSGQLCAIFAGMTPRPPATQEGEANCTHWSTPPPPPFPWKEAFTALALLAGGLAIGTAAGIFRRGETTSPPIAGV